MLKLLERLLRFWRARAAEKEQHRAYQAFLASGNKPWTPGYELHKQLTIERAINDPTLDLNVLPRGFGWRLDERVVEYPWLLSRLPEGEGKILDAGSSLNHSYLLRHPKLAQKRCYIVTLAPESSAAWDKGVSYLYEDLRELSFKDNCFDLVTCISTLEHVGLDNTFLYTSDATKKEVDAAAFVDCLRQLKRVITSGGRLFLSVPYGRAVHHGWFQVFDAQKVDEIVAAFSPTAYTETIFRYEADGWVCSSREDAAGATYFDIHKSKDYDPDYAAASRAVACLELVK